MIGAVLNKAEEDNVKFVELWFTDMHGMAKTVTIPVEKLQESLEKGTWFDGSSIEGFTPIAASDMLLVPDPATYAVIPWLDKDPATCRLICDVYTPEGKPFEGDPRCILKKVMKEAEEIGYEYNVGPELEFFLLKKDECGCITTSTHDGAMYFDFAPRDLAIKIRQEMILALEAMGLIVEMSHHEVAPGQHEIDFQYADAVRTADNAITLKMVLKNIATKYDLHCTFMPKPLFGVNGSGMHCHQSLKDIKTGKNAFYEPNDSYKLSSVAKSFIAGQLHNVRGFTAVIAPLVNSYKRLVPGYEAPVYISWAKINRSALIRIPRYSPGKEQATRAELRCPDPSSCPYLAFAVMLKAGLDGVKNKMVPPAPIEQNIYHLDEESRKSMGVASLPSSLGEAVQELKRNKLIQDALGQHTCKAFIEAKEAEWNNYRIQVTKWEHESYLEKF